MEQWLQWERDDKSEKIDYLKSKLASMEIAEKLRTEAEIREL